MTDSKSFPRLKKLSTFQIIIMSFIGLIVFAALVLMLPISSASGEWTSFPDALFTATSACCVTGLIVHNTATYWSLFGKIMLLIFIQIGGMGTITIFAELNLLIGNKLGLRQRGLIQDALSLPEIGNSSDFITFVIKSVLIMEGAGAVLLSLVFLFVYRLPASKAIAFGIFHSISAYCNAGFDLMGEAVPYISLVGYKSSVYINIIIMLLIISGGLGFITYGDIYTYKLKVKKYRMQTKVILITSLILIFVPALLFFFFEFNDYPIKTRILTSLFQSVTARTAGFNTVDFAEMSEPGIAVMIFLMLIGGSPGSTAGGYKTTTLAVLCASAIAVFTRKSDTSFFGRRISPNVVRNAAAIVLLYFISFFVSGLLICRIEGLPLLTCLFETGSAAGTVGLSMGATPTLSGLSRAILIFQMFWGRVGGLTLIFATAPNTTVTGAKFPEENIMVG